MSEFNFKSAICTSREQSERLLALGLKKETADMCHRTNGMGIYFVTAINPLHNPCDIPAWSLHRLLSLLPTEIPCEYENSLGMFLGEENSVFYFGAGDYYTHANLYDATISCIEGVIREGYFNKEYLI